MALGMYLDLASVASAATNAPAGFGPYRTLLLFLIVSAALSVTSFLLAAFSWIGRRRPRGDMASLHENVERLLAFFDEEKARRTGDLELRSDVKFIKQDLSMIRELVYELLQRDDEREAAAAEHREGASDQARRVRRAVPAARVANAGLAEFFTSSKD